MQNNWDLSATIVVEADDFEELARMIRAAARRIKWRDTHGEENTCMGTCQFSVVQRTPAHLPDDDSFERKVEAIAGPDGWWKSNTGETYHEAAGKLIELGLAEDEAVEFLRKLHGASAQEFGL